MSKYLIICCIAGILFSGCNKEDEYDNSFRLKSWNDTANKHGVFIHYMNNKVSEVLVFYNGEVYTRNVWSYEDNKITIREHNKNVYTGWVEEPEYRILTFNDQNRLAQCEYIADGLVLRENYYWEGDRLIRQEKFLKDGRTFITTFTYKDNLLISTTGHQYFDYKEGLVQSMSYIKNSDTISYFDFLHVGGFMTAVIYGTSRADLSYDSNGNLEKRIYSLKEPYFSYSSATFFEYERGSGNLDIYWLITKGWVHAYLYPNMLPPFSQNEGFHFD